ncbi:MAG: metal-dependent transcriptional regulator [Thermoprotei archaeon]|nr:MAG: metal-dependent transcriptional regulator [Thermoprotei archaeon]
MVGVLSRREASYLVAIYSISGSSPARLKEIALYVGVRPPTALEALYKLSSRGLVVKEARGRYRLSREGLRLVEALIRKHRVLETFLVRTLGLCVDEACRLASAFDYAVPMELVDKMCGAMGHPSCCPHGNPIPAGNCHPPKLEVRR